MPTTTLNQRNRNAELLEIMGISGLGPATIKLLHDKAHINNRQELTDAILTGKLQGIRGNELTKLRQVTGITVCGETMINMMLSNNIQVDVRIVEEKEFGAAMLHLMGVSVARRAGCKKSDILNTRHWDDIVKFKEHKLDLFQEKNSL